MGVPAFYRWLSQKYPKIVQDVVEERVHLLTDSGTIRAPFDCTKPNPSGLETDNLYIDMNGIIHPCSHPEHGPQPSCEEDMYLNVCRYVDRLFRAVRPRKLLYLAIDGVAPRAKMNQQRSRRFRAAQEAREHAEMEERIRSELARQGVKVPPSTFVTNNAPWDSNVITPGTPFMLGLSDYIRFYIRKRITHDPAWQAIQIIFSDASIPGEGEHKIMSHIRLQRCQPNYNPNLVHVLHGLDADLIMLALATHEAHFYILREEVLFGRKSEEEADKRKEENGYYAQQRQLDEEAGVAAMEFLPENKHKPLQRISIPILREYLANEFRHCARVPFYNNRKEISFERVIDDIVFLCFFVGNDFLPHLPSLDIRDGALDFLFNVYKRVLPTLGDYITGHGGTVNLSHVDVILAEVGGIEDYVFQMKHENERNEERRKEQRKAAKRRKKGRGGGEEAPPLDCPGGMMMGDDGVPVVKKTLGRAARILEKRMESEEGGEVVGDGGGSAQGGKKEEDAAAAAAAAEDPIVPLSRGHLAKEDRRKKLKEDRSKKGEENRTRSAEENAKAAAELKATLLGIGKSDDDKSRRKDDTNKTNQTAKLDVGEKEKGSQGLSPKKRKSDEIAKSDDGDNEDEKEMFGDSDEKDMFGDSDDDEMAKEDTEEEVEEVDAATEDDEEEDDEEDQAAKDEAERVLKEKVKEAKEKQLEQFANEVKDNVRLHEEGWKDRYYKDKCKADDVENHGGREHMFRSYVMGLCWVMKYYYDGCPSWKWYYPFHYAPFASDLRNIERFRKDCDSFDISEPFKPVEQLMGVLPEDSSHAIPKAARWLMQDEESPIIDFYPKTVPVDPNGKKWPWLWVVLLPFIDESRLLDALKPTMTKWTKKELLCNARGLDDGYLYIHMSHRLASTVSIVLNSGEKTAKLDLLRKAAGKLPGFAGLVRPPLSNEVYPLDEDVTIHPPPSSSKITSEIDDNVFSESIEPNEALCVAFSEPRKRPHRSILLPGAQPPNPTLTEEDKRIRRPRLNFGGGTIANLGTGRDMSHKAGYGSMNISTYERGLANRMGRGGQMYQAGTRAWGAMEPTPKRQRYNDWSDANGGGYRGGYGGGRGGYSQSYRPNLHEQAHSTSGSYNSQQTRRNPMPNNRGGRGQQQGYYQSSKQDQNRKGVHQRWQPPPPPPPPPPPLPPTSRQYHGFQSQYQQQGGYQQQQYSAFSHQSQPYVQGAYAGSNMQQTHQHLQPQGFSFRGHNQSSQAGQNSHTRNFSQSGGGRPGQKQVSNQSQSRVNPNLMNSLRSQLKSTLQKNRQSGGRGGS